MYITLEADYAVRIILYLLRENKRADAKTISSNTGVTIRFALKILNKLVSSGLVNSFKGKNGGYEVAKSASDISLYDVIYVIDGPCVLSRCLLEDKNCTHDPDDSCKIRHEFFKISELIHTHLDKVKFDSLV